MPDPTKTQEQGRAQAQAQAVEQPVASPVTPTPPSTSTSPSTSDQTVLDQVALPHAVEAVLRETEWKVVQEVARSAVKSKLTKWKTEAEAIAIVMTGRELGLGPMTSLRLMHLIEGKVGLETQLMHALVLRRVPGARINFLERSSQRCAVRVSRPNFDPADFEFTLEEAKEAGLLGKPNWKYRRAMLSSRARSAAIREYFPDATTGLWTVEELQDMQDDPEAVARELEELKADVESMMPNVPFTEAELKEGLREAILGKARASHDVEVLRALVDRAQARIFEQQEREAVEAARVAVAVEAAAKIAKETKAKEKTEAKETGVKETEVKETKSKEEVQAKSPADATAEEVG